MDNMVVPVLGIAVAAAVTFYAVSFSELSEKSFRDLDEREADDGFKPSMMTSREKRAARAGAKTRRAQEEAAAQQKKNKN